MGEWAPVRPRLGPGVVGRIVGPSDRRERDDAAGEQTEIGVELVALCVVDVVAGAEHEIDRGAACARGGVGAEQFDVRCDGPRHQRFLGPVHVQQRTPPRIVSECLDPLEPHRRGGIEQVQVAQVTERADELADHRPVGRRRAELEAADTAAMG